MSEPNWIQLAKDYKVTAVAKDNNVWQLVVPVVDALGYLKILATGDWSYSTKYVLKCSPNGDLHSPFNSDSCLHSDSPIGCLIGRIGGSSASKTATDVFTIGAYCVRKIEDDKGGPLFMACNDLWTGFDDNSGELTVNVFFASKLA